jgi:hypothetical protein
MRSLTCRLLAILRLCLGPGESRHSVRGRHPARMEAGPNEEDRRRRSRSDGRPERTESLVTPAVGEATTRMRASAAASTTPVSPGRIRNGSVTIPTTCCTSSDARASNLLASLRPNAGSASLKNAVQVRGPWPRRGC